VRHRVGGAADATFRSLHSRNFRLFFFGQLVSQIGNWLTRIASALLVLKLTDNGVAVGVLTACQFAPVLVLGPWAGLVADRSDKHRLLMVVQSLAMLQSFALAAIAFLENPPVAALYGVALAGGLTTAFDNPARRAFVVEMVPADNVQNAVGLNTAMMTASRVVGPALAGLLIHTVGYGWCFSVDGLSYFAVLASLAAMRRAELRTPPPSPRGKGQVREGLRYVLTVPELRIPLAMTAVIGTFTFNFPVVLPLLVQRSLGGDDATFTLLYSVLSVGSLIGALVAARRVEVGVQSVVYAAFAFGLAMFALAAAPSLSWVFPAGFAVGIMSVAFMTSSTAMVQLRADPALRGRVLALQAMVVLGSTPIGGPILGALCEWLGARAGVLVGGVAALAAGAGGLWTWRREDARRPAPVPGHAAIGTATR